MQPKGNFLRILFGANLLFFAFCMFSPWVLSSGNRYYYSFQVVTYSGHSGYTNLLLEWDFWFSPDTRISFSDYWFSREMYYEGFTYEWIRIFILQSLTVLSSVLILFAKWQKTSFMLAPFLFSVYGEFLGLLLVARYMYISHNYGHPAWGLPYAMFSTLFFLLLFLFRYRLERKKGVRGHLENSLQKLSITPSRGTVKNRTCL